MWPKFLVPILIGAAIGALTYWGRQLWVPRLTSVFDPAHAVTSPAPALGLNVVALDSQLEIRWNRNSGAIAGSPGGVLRVAGAGPSTKEIWLDHQHLLSGAFTVANPSERVDVSLALNQSAGPPVSEATSFLGKLPQSRQANAANSEELAKLRADLDDQIQRSRKLQKDLDFLARQFRDLRSRGKK